MGAEKADIYLESMPLKIHAPNDVFPQAAYGFSRCPDESRERKRCTAWRNGRKLVRPGRDDHVRRRGTSTRIDYPSATSDAEISAAFARSFSTISVNRRSAAVNAIE
jgi:hypothetical protein